MNTSVPRRARRHPSTRLAGFGAVALIVAACGGSAAPGASSPAASGAPVASPSAGQASGAASAEGSAAAPPSEVAATTGPTPAVVAGDIGSVIPTEIAGHPMRIEVYTSAGDNFLFMWQSEDVALKLLESLGKTKDDVTAAQGNADDIKSPESLFVYAYRVAGADGQALRDGMVERYLALFDGWDAPMRTMAGKSVAVMGPKGDEESAGQAFYAVGDIVFNITSNHPEWIEAAVALLP
jgi:hypothetical protein